MVPDGVPYWASSPEELKTQMLTAVHTTLTQCRDQATALVEQHRDAIVTFAGPLYARRRLEGEALQALLAEAVSA